MFIKASKIWDFAYIRNTELSLYQCIRELLKVSFFLAERTYSCDSQSDPRLMQPAAQRIIPSGPGDHILNHLIKKCQTPLGFPVYKPFRILSQPGNLVGFLTQSLISGMRSVMPVCSFTWDKLLQYGNKGFRQ